MSKTKIAAFAATFKTPSGADADGNLIIGFPSGKKTFGHWLFQANDGGHFLFRTFVEGAGRFIDPPADDPGIVTLLGSEPTPHPERVRLKDITIRAKIDALVIRALGRSEEHTSELQSRI